MTSRQNEPDPNRGQRANPREGMRDSNRIRPRVRSNRPQSPELAESESPVNEPRFQVPDAEDSKPIDGIDQKKRSIALVFDILVAFTIALIVSVFTSLIGIVIGKFIPGITRLLSKELFIVIFILLKDGLYGGRGIGKNLMGLRVVDAKSESSCTFSQSVKRNILFIVPFLVQFSVQLSSPFLPKDLSMAAGKISEILCMVYVLTVIPLECYLAYSGLQGRRLGDKLAGTKVVESEMRFSDPLK